MTTAFRIFDAFLRRQSIEPVAYCSLVSTFLLMDLRNQQFGKSTATGPKARIAPLFWVLGQNLIVGLICSVVMFARVDALFFTLVGLSTSILIVVSAVIVEFREIVLDPQDLNVLGHRPIPARTYAAARVTNLLGYLLVFSISAGLFPTIVGMGLRDAGWWHGVTYFSGALIGDFLAAGICILVYACLQRDGPPNAFQESAAWLQVALILVLFYGGQVILRDGSQPLSWISYDLPHGVWYLPISWLAHGICIAGHGSVVGFEILAAGIALTLGVWWAALRRLSKLYARLQPGRPAWAPQSSPPLPGPGQLTGALGNWITHAGEERVAFWLTWTMLDRDPNLRMRCWPSFAIVIALFGVGALTGQLANPFAVPSSQCVLTLAAVSLIGEAVPALIHQLRYSGEHEASWVLATSPVTSLASFARGMCKALWCRFVFPLCVLAMILFCWNWQDLFSSAIHSVLVGLMGWCFLCGCSTIQCRFVPFASPLAKGESFGPIAGLTAATTAVAMVFATVHGATVGNKIWFAIYIASVVIVTIFAHIFSERSLNRPHSEETKW